MKKSKPHTKREVIVATWERLRRPAAGEKELREIQRVLAGQFGEEIVDSPAAIARVLADEGAEFRHPEVIEFDARWREAHIRKRAADDVVGAADRPLTLLRAARLIAKLEKARKQSDHEGDKTNLRRVRDLAITEKQRAQSLARSSRLNDRTRSEQAEIAEWLRVWLQTPDLFGDWLDLRRRSSEFQKRFSDQRS